MGKKELRPMGLDDIETASAYIRAKQSAPASSCKVCPRDIAAIQSHLRNLIDHPDDFVLVVYTDGTVRAGRTGGAITGLGAFLHDPAGSYLECLGGFYDNEADFALILGYLRGKFRDHRIDFVYPPENTTALGYLQRAGAVFEKAQRCFEIGPQDFIPKPARQAIDSTVPEIVPLSDPLRAEYCRIHQDEGRYWTAERVMAAPETFKVFLSMDGDRAAGYIDSTYNKDPAEIYDLFIVEDYWGTGRDEALLNRAISELLTGRNRLFVQVDADDASIAALYTGFGALETSRSQTASLLFVARV
ncbi:MAG: hypothetical protein LBT11_05945 [Treponema sp.]|jgi:GNAT superfamily N-acetyltransferase|nr:hypothetical protein [Treponema sp.]